MGGHGLRIPAAARAPRAGVGAVDGGGYPGAGRPAGGNARRRSGRPLSPVPARGAHGGPRPRRAGASRHRLRGPRRGSAACRGGLRTGRRGVRGPGPGPDSRVRRAGGRRAVDLRGHPRAAPAGGHRARAGPATRHRHALPRTALRPLRRWLLASRVRLRAGVGARLGRPRRACLLRRPARRIPATGGHRGGTGRRSHRLGDDLPGLERDVGLSGASALPRLPPPHHSRPASVEQQRRAVRPGGCSRPGARARARLRGSRRRQGRPGLLRRWTPSCSGIGGTRAWSGSRRCSRRRPGKAWTWSRSARASTAWSRCAPS